jgi:hypothetical protein
MAWVSGVERVRKESWHQASGIKNRFWALEWVLIYNCFVFVAPEVCPEGHSCFAACIVWPCHYSWNGGPHVSKHFSFDCFVCFGLCYGGSPSLTFLLLLDLLLSFFQRFVRDRDRITLPLPFP